MNNVLSVEMIRENFEVLKAGVINLGFPEPDRPEDIADLIMTNHFGITKKVERQELSDLDRFLIGRKVAVMVDTNPIKAAYEELLNAGTPALA